MEESKKQETCEQRIDTSLKSRLEELFPAIGDWGVRKCAKFLKEAGRETTSADVDELREEILELNRTQAIESLLSVEKKTTFKLCLSYGGPADYFELDWSEDSREWVGGRYIFQDWYDGANRPLTAQQAEEIAELYGIYPEAS